MGLKRGKTIGWAEGQRREGQVCREVYVSKEDEEEEKEASEAQHEDAPCATQDKSMGYGEVVCVCVCVCVFVFLSLSLSLSLSPVIPGGQEIGLGSRNLRPRAQVQGGGTSHGARRL